MALISEFKKFAMRGNVIDMAVGIIIGAAFGKIVSSLVIDVIMPPLGLLLGGINFTDFRIVLKEAVPASIDTAGALVATQSEVSINYGQFIQVTLDFVIIAAAFFMMLKAINRLKREKEVPEAPIAPSKQELLLTEIRDLMKNKTG